LIHHPLHGQDQDVNSQKTPKTDAKVEDGTAKDTNGRPTLQPTLNLLERDIVKVNKKIDTVVKHYTNVVLVAQEGLVDARHFHGTMEAINQPIHTQVAFYQKIIVKLVVMVYSGQGLAGTPTK
jgi:hypothetical protein